MVRKRSEASGGTYDSIAVRGKWGDLWFDSGQRGKCGGTYSSISVREASVRTYGPIAVREETYGPIAVKEASEGDLWSGCTQDGTCNI